MALEYVLLEDGTNVLLEDGTNVLLESSSDPAVPDLAGSWTAGHVLVIGGR